MARLFGSDRLRSRTEKRLSGRRPTTRGEIEEKMDELARKYVETHDKTIIEELYKLVKELEKLEKAD
jgi:hypothetical protein